LVDAGAFLELGEVWIEKKEPDFYENIMERSIIEVL
jgi:hypothetical protein